MSDDTLRVAAADGAATDLETGAWYAIHSDATAGTQVSNERIQPTYNAASGTGVAALTATLSFTGPASQAATHLGVWDAVSTGNFRFSVPLSGDLAFNAAGELQLTAANVTVAAA